MDGWSLVVPDQDASRDSAERVVGRPHPVLAGRVLGYTAHRFRDTGATPWLLTPLGAVTLTLDIEAPTRRLLAPPPQQGQELPGSPVIGLRDRPLALEQSGRSVGIVVALTPAAAHAVLGLPLQVLGDAPLGLTDLLGPNAVLLQEQVAETPGWPARFRLLDRFLAVRLARGPAMAEPVARAWELLVASSGRTGIGELADQVGWTRQHLAVRFREQVGSTPKTVARLARVHHAAALLSSPSPPSLADVAQQCGYADQAHLHRDFRMLTGCTPGRAAFAVQRG